MVLRVWEVFPQFSVDVIRRDLASTRSPERTIERILSGRVSADGTAGGEGNILDDVDVELRWGLSALWDALWNPLGRRETEAPPPPPAAATGATPVVSPRQQPAPETPTQSNGEPYQEER
ncbi:hypothetical protein PINS_up020719 [Pythium insidiosum]|nr:hypothetical protein PINS_up020719 [Pythium insidiosum]